MSYIFYCYDGDGSEIQSRPVDARMSVEIWRPRLTRIAPPGLSDRSYAVWWAFHHLHVFRNRDYGVLVVRNGGSIVHRSGLFPPYFRFPFMAVGDLQIGDVWTAPEYRRRGIALAALRFALVTCARPGRRIWYVVEDTNTASIRTAESLGLRRVGLGDKVRRMGAGLLGCYQISSLAEPGPGLR